MADKMRLYFFRHAQAEAGANAMTDGERPLTSRGVERTKHAAQVMKALKIKPERLYSSPLTRARQTAEILAKTLGVDVHSRSEVGPGFHVQAVEALLHESGHNEVMFVGHEPDFSATVSALVGGGWITMKKGALARVDIDQRQPLRGSLVWLIAPKVFDAL